MEIMEEQIIIDENGEDVKLTPTREQQVSGGRTIHKMVGGRHMRTNRNFDAMMEIIGKPTMQQIIRAMEHESGMCVTEVRPIEVGSILRNHHMKQNLPKELVREINSHLDLDNKLIESRVFALLACKEPYVVGARLKVKNIRELALLMDRLAREGIIIDTWQAMCEKREMFVSKMGKVIDAKTWSKSLSEKKYNLAKK